MIIRHGFLAFVAILILFSISQLFLIPPFAGDIFPIYKSGYFDEIEKGYNVIKDSFVEIKMLSKPVYSWIFLDDIEKKHNIIIKVYNSKGKLVPAPGEESDEHDIRVTDIINSIDPNTYSEIQEDSYYSAIPLFFEDRCRFCHQNYKKNLIGIISFKRKYNSYIYYSSERIIIFTSIAAILSILFFLILKWDPEKRIKEIFDKL